MHSLENILQYDIWLLAYTTFVKNNNNMLQVIKKVFNVNKCNAFLK